MKNGKFLRAIEKTKKYSQVFDGLVTKEGKSEIEMICQGPEMKDKIQWRTFEKKEWEFRPAKAEDVKHLFEGAVFSADKALLEAEFELADAKHAVKKQNELMKRVFG